MLVCHSLVLHHIRQFPLHLFTVLVDDYSHYCWSFPLWHKSDVHTQLVNFVSYAHTQFNLPIKCFRWIMAESINNTTSMFLSTRGILLRTSCPYTSAQNSKAERM